MFSVSDIRAEYTRLDRKCGVDTSNITIEISARAKKRLGCFRCSGSYPNETMQIVISAWILQEPEQFWDTIRHEYAHALVHLREPSARHGHDMLWKSACREVGCRPERIAPAKGRARTKYTLVCKTCGEEFHYMRICKAVTLVREGHDDRLRCPHCKHSGFRLISSVADG